MNSENEIDHVVTSAKRAGKYVGIFSFVINLLLLVSPIYMLQLYDRVLSSGSKETLLVLTIMAVFLLALLAALEVVRNKIMVLLSGEVDGKLKDGLYNRVIRLAAAKGPDAGTQAFRDLDMVRQFLASKAPFVFFDAPWAPLFLIVVFIIHPWLGVLSLMGAIIIFALAYVAEKMSRQLLAKAGGLARWSNQFLDMSLRNHEVLRAMNLAEGLKQNWEEKRGPGLAMAEEAADRIGLIYGATKGIRIGLQVLVLGLGGYLALEQVISAGSIVAASIIMGRALAPVEQAIGAWRNISSSRDAYIRLKGLIDQMPADHDAMALPRPTADIKVTNLIGGLPGTQDPLLKSLDFTVQPGRVVGIIGPSGAGKSVFLRHLIGVMPPIRGHVRLGGVELSSWHDEDRGHYVGYLPQDVELFSGTVAQNIARFGEVDAEKVYQAAEKAGCHQLILGLSKGYETEIGTSGQFLSGGQCQRIALARAVYNDPVMVALDEPDSNLDTEGEISLANCIDQLKKTGVTVFMVSHNTRLFGVVDDVLVIKDGKQMDFGERQSVMQKFIQSAPVKEAGGQGA